MSVFDLDRIGAGLPVSAARAELLAAARTGALVVTAPPGTGKTTLLPPLVADLVEGRTLVTQPRRVAVRAAARRLATLDGGRIGERVGFTVRGQRSVGADTRIEMLTPGVLLRRLLADPALPGVGAVLLDEVHERSLETDLLLGMLAEARLLREDLLVGAMSATLDAQAVAALLGGAPVVEVPSPLHPLEISYAPSPALRLDARGVTREYLAHLAGVVARTRTDGDALVFLPGVREVDETVRRVRELVGPGTEVLPLHGRLPAAAQDRATGGRSPGDPPRIVVSTALAESSLTVPGVDLVIDAGLSREVRRDRGRDMSGLVTVSASHAALTQRAGRAARQGPGRAVRVLAETDLAGMPAHSPPEITTSDLTDAALQLACWGTPRGEGLALLTPPPVAEITAAEETLRALDLVDADGRPTAEGTAVARMPVGVREARALRGGSARQAAEVVATVSGDQRPDGGDLDALLRGLRRERPEAWRREADRLERLAPGGEPVSDGHLLARARPERIARRVGPRSLLLASGTRAALPEGSGLIGHDWVAVWEVQRAEGRAADGTGAVVRAAAALTEEAALAAGAGLLRTERIARLEDGAVRVRQVRRLGAIELSSTPVGARAEDTVPAVLGAVRAGGLGVLRWSEAASSLRARLDLLHRELGAPWPAMDDASLEGRLEEWLAPQVSARTTRLEQVDLLAGLRSLLPWPEAAALDELVPTRLGPGQRVDYALGERPVVAVRLQEVLGLSETPRLVRGRVPVLFHLLSPARRPLAVTDDLHSFWDGPYQQVRKEMRGRYPKHSWPEDPLTS
ncbi:ATP-dependent helicase HrpB [Brachybacterium sp. J144]|uniref:ATP-dependent helicase HrpB n=1 Tax=unclassified Brachybacterium TaxID=2623841 RepID=UPI002E77F868|nr:MULTISPECIES: ATP-dependent helicase HrpB [unclassified Brachybacterium]MEE1619562.1 ATP-dependent helicase HrpB [Brachybacterium sp. J153]MEE1650039.1 ATP-dependent helicase HrpB [Brachybacterium sp. J144]